MSAGRSRYRPAPTDSGNMMPHPAQMIPSLRRPVWSWLLLAGYALVLFIQSSFPSPDVGPDFPGQDKLLHLAAYALMGYLACRAFATLPALRSLWFVCVAGLLFAVLFGLSDEWHQSFVPGRQADGWDLAADTLGAVIGAAAYAVYRRARASAGSAFPR